MSLKCRDLQEFHYLPMFFARILSLYFLSVRDCFLLSRNHISEKTHGFLRIINSVILSIVREIIIRNERSEVNRLHLFRAFCCRYIEVTFSTYHTVRLYDEHLFMNLHCKDFFDITYNIHILIYLYRYHALKKILRSFMAFASFEPVLISFLDLMITQYHLEPFKSIRGM